MIESLARRQYLPKLKEEAYRLLLKNSAIGEKDGKRYRYTVPSLANHLFKNHAQYPFQWCWDSWKYALVWLSFDPERAKDEIRSLLAWQEPSGRIPQVIFWDQSKVRRALWHWHYWESRGPFSFLPWCKKPKTSAQIQPPGIAHVVLQIWKKTGDVVFVEEVLPALTRYYAYLARERDYDKDGLISIISQFESGVDYSPAYDPAIGTNNPGPWRLFIRSRLPQYKNKILFNYNLGCIFRWSDHHIEDILVNSIYAQSLFALGELASVCTCPPEADPPSAENARSHVPRETYLVEETGETLEIWAKRQAEKTRKALLEKCWDSDAGLFWNLAGKKEMLCKVKTIISLIPLIIPGLPKDVVERLVGHLVNSGEFWTPYPIASVSRDEPAFRPDNRIRGRFLKTCRYRFLWRGAVFNNEKHFLIEGLWQYGYAGIAENLAAIWLRNTYYNGFNEAHDALTGRPVETPDFGWAMLVVVQ